MKKSRRIVAFLISAVVLITAFCGSVIAAEAATTTTKSSIPASTAKCQFIANDGKSVVTMYATHPLGAPSDVYMIKTPGEPSAAFTPEGFQFAGWSTTKNAESGFSASTYMRVKGATRFYAAYKPVESATDITNITVIVDLNGGTGAAKTVTVSCTDAKTVSVEIPTDLKPARSGYKFLGWNTNKGSMDVFSGNPVVIEKGVGEDTITIYAIWEADKKTSDSTSSGKTGHSKKTTTTAKTYTISFNANGGEASSVPAAIKVNAGSAATIPGKGATYEEHAFLYWTTDAAGKGTVYKLGANITPASNMTLYAQWGSFGFNPDPKPTEIHYYRIQFNANGGSGAPAAQGGQGGTEIKITSKEPTWTNHGFYEWNTKADGTGTAYHAGDTITLSKDMVLYAQWHAYGYVPMSPAQEIIPEIKEEPPVSETER